MRLRRRVLGTIAVTAAAVGLVMGNPASSQARTSDPIASGSPTPMARPAAGTFYPTDAERVVGGTSGGHQVSPNSPLTVSTASSAGLPSSGMSAVVANLTVTAGSSDVSVGAAPTVAGGVAATLPGLLGVPAGTTRSSLLTIPLGPLGSFDVAVTGGVATVTADVVGFYAADDTVVAARGVSGGYQPITARRLVDATGAAAVPAGASKVIGVDLGSAANEHATALLVRVSARDTTAAGALTATAPLIGPLVATPAAPPTSAQSAAESTAQGLPHMAAVSFSPASPASNLAVIPARLGEDGTIGLEVGNVSMAPVGVVVDLVGFYDDGTIGPNLRFRPLPQTRVIDTRAGVAMTPLVSGRPQTVTPASTVVGDSTFGLVGVLTTTTATATSVDVTPEAPETTEPAGQVAAGAILVSAGSTSSAVQVEVATARTVAVGDETGTQSAQSAPSVPSAPSVASAPPPPTAPSSPTPPSTPTPSSTPTASSLPTATSLTTVPPLPTATSLTTIPPLPTVPPLPPLPTVPPLPAASAGTPAPTASAPAPPAPGAVPTAPAAPVAQVPTQVTFDVVGSFEAYPPVVTPSSRGWVAPISGWQVGAVAR